MAVFLNYPADNLRIYSAGRFENLLFEIRLLQDIVSIHVKIGYVFSDDMHTPENKDPCQNQRGVFIEGSRA